MAKTKIEKSMVNDMPVGVVVGESDTQTLTNKTLTTPTIGDFSNATHAHSGATSGGVIDHVSLNNKGTNTHAQIDSHIANITTNPHSVDATDVGLGNVTNVATSNVAYNATTWNGNTDSAAKNAIRDKIVSMDSSISSNTSASHTQNTDTALGSGCVAADHGTASTDQVVNVCYGTSATPPTASTTTEGALYIQYTA